MQRGIALHRQNTGLPNFRVLLSLQCSHLSPRKSSRNGGWPFYGNTPHRAIRIPSKKELGIRPFISLSRYRKRDPHVVSLRSFTVTQCIVHFKKAGLAAKTMDSAASRPPHPSPREGLGVGSAIGNTATGREYGGQEPDDDLPAHKERFSSIPETRPSRRVAALLHVAALNRALYRHSAVERVGGGRKKRGSRSRFGKWSGVRQI